LRRGRDVATVNLQARDDFEALRLLIETASENSLADSYEIKVTVGFMRGLHAREDALRELLSAVLDAGFLRGSMAKKVRAALSALDPASARETEGGDA
jgi:hypothetical protein